MGTNRILKKPNLIRNAIDKQIKQRGVGLTVDEWNQVVNALRVQTNLNTKYLEDLHRLLFYDWDQNSTGYVIAADAFDNGFLTEVLQAVEAMVDDVNTFRVQVYNYSIQIVDLVNMVENFKTYHYSVDPPASFREGDLWIQPEED